MKSICYIRWLIGFSMLALVAGCETPTLRSNCWSGAASSARGPLPEVTRGLGLDSCP